MKRKRPLRAPNNLKNARVQFSLPGHHCEGIANCVKTWEPRFILLVRSIIFAPRNTLPRNLKRAFLSQTSFGSKILDVPNYLMQADRLLIKDVKIIAGSARRRSQSPSVMDPPAETVLYIPELLRMIFGFMLFKDILVFSPNRRIRQAVLQFLFAEKGYPLFIGSGDRSRRYGARFDGSVIRHITARFFRYITYVQRRRRVFICVSLSGANVVPSCQKCYSRLRLSVRKEGTRWPSGYLHAHTITF